MCILKSNFHSVLQESAADKRVLFYFKIAINLVDFKVLALFFKVFSTDKTHFYHKLFPGQ